MSINTSTKTPINTPAQATPQWFRLWIVTYGEWRPARWNEVPPQATALELVEDRLYGAYEAALFVEGFNRAVLGGAPPVWAVAVPITIRYLGDVEPGASVVGYVFAESSGEEAVAANPAAEETSENSPAAATGAHFHGLGQSPQRSR